MILITLGTQFFPFKRTVSWLEQLFEEGLIDEPVLLQHGSTPVNNLSHPLLKTVPSLELEAIQEAARRSSLVVSHAGQGSARMLARLGANFVLVPRLKRYGEHIDDHQLYFAQAVSRLGVSYCTEYSELARFVRQPPAPLEGELFQTTSLADHLAVHLS